MKFGLSGNILVFALTDLMGNFARGMVFSYAALYILALGGSPPAVGWVGLMGLAAGLVILPIAGHITDHSNRVQLLVLSGGLSSLLLVMTILAQSWQVLAVASLLFGAIVFQFPAYASLVADSLPPGDRGRGLGLMNAISSSLAIFAPFVAGLVIERYTANLGMRILYTCMLVLYLTATLIQWRFLREPSSHLHQPLTFASLTTALAQAYRGIPGLTRQMSRPLRGLAWIILLSFLANGVASPFWVVYATEQIGLSPAQWGTILLVESAVRLIAFIPAGLLADRRGRTRMLLLALFLSLITHLLFVVFKSFWAILLIRTVIAIAFALALPACMALMADLVPRHLRGQMMAAIGQGGIMIGPAGGGAGGPALGYLFILPVMLASLAGGYLYKAYPASPWLFSAFTALASIVVLLSSVRDPHQAEE